MIIPRKCGCGFVHQTRWFMGVLLLFQRAGDRYTVSGCLIGTLRVNEVLRLRDSCWSVTAIPNTVGELVLFWLVLVFQKGLCSSTML